MPNMPAKEFPLFAILFLAMILVTPASADDQFWVSNFPRPATSTVGFPDLVDKIESLGICDGNTSEKETVFGRPPDFNDWPDVMGRSFHQRFVCFGKDHLGRRFSIGVASSPYVSRTDSHDTIVNNLQFSLINKREITEEEIANMPQYSMLRSVSDTIGSAFSFRFPASGGPNYLWIIAADEIPKDGILNVKKYGFEFLDSKSVGVFLHREFVGAHISTAEVDGAFADASSGIEGAQNMRN